MKNLFLLLAFLTPNLIFAQGYIGIQWNDIHPGRTIGISYTEDFRKVKLEIGLTTFINRPNQSPGSDVFFKTGQATEINEKIGGNFSLFLPILTHKRFSLDGGYKGFYSYLGIKGTWYSKPFNFIEHNLGFNLEYKITDQLVLSQQFGGGVVFLTGKNSPLHNYNDNWELGYFATTGLKYRIQ